MTLLLATESVKNDLSEIGNVVNLLTYSLSHSLTIVSKIKTKLNTDVFGAVASSVTSLHMPKLFLSSADNGDFEKYNNGIIGITLSGNVSTQSVIARSCLPVGPVFSVEEVNGIFVYLLSHPLTYSLTCLLGREIIGLRNLDDGTLAPPLVQLEQVLETITTEQSYLLKRELLIGASLTHILTHSLTYSPIYRHSAKAIHSW